jgi:hypothetical protein
MGETPVNTRLVARDVTLFITFLSLTVGAHFIDHVILAFITFYGGIVPLMIIVLNPNLFGENDPPAPMDTPPRSTPEQPPSTPETEP